MNRPTGPLPPPRRGLFSSVWFWLGVAWRTLLSPSFAGVLRSRVGRRPIAVTGVEHLPANGAFVMAANHYYAGATLDVIAATLVSAAQVRPGIDDTCAVVIGQRHRPKRRRMARVMLWFGGRVFHRWRKNVLRIQTTKGTPVGLAALREWRRRGRTVPTLVFPEGVANRVFADVRPGAASWLAGIGVPVVPVGVWWDTDRWNVAFGAPIAWASDPDLGDLQLGLAMASLLPEALAPAWQPDLASWRRAHDAPLTIEARGAFQAAQ